MWATVLFHTYIQQKDTLKHNHLRTYLCKHLTSFTHTITHTQAQIPKLLWFTPRLTHTAHSSPGMHAVSPIKNQASGQTERERGREEKENRERCLFVLWFPLMYAPASQQYNSATRERPTLQRLQRLFCTKCNCLGSIWNDMHPLRHHNTHSSQNKKELF